MSYRSITTVAALLATAALLSACELRRDGPPEEPEPTETTDMTTPSPSPTASETPSSSIIREDFVPTEVEEEQEAEPLNVTIPFPEGSDVDERAERMLADVLESAAIDEDWPITLGGHTDSSGNDDANLRASRARAEAVAAWLVERGVDDDRIEVVAFGEQNPIEPNARPDGTPNREGRRANRRVEIRIAPEEDGEAEAPAPRPRSTPAD